MNHGKLFHAAHPSRVLVLAVAAGTLFVLGHHAVVRAQATLVVDAPKAAADEKKSPDKGGEAKKSDAKIGDADAAGRVNDGQVLGFRQSEVAAQMTELEERMFRLSEAIRQLEPENSSRLLLGLKYAREELILHQMKETQDLLGKMSLGEAVVEQKHLVSKLQRLHDMLLSADLDLQMRLERLRLLREIMRRLDKAVAEEEREQTQSRDTAALEKEVEALDASRVTLVGLVKRQRSHVEESKPLAGLDALNDEQTKSVATQAQEQQKTHQDAQKLANANAAEAAKLEHLATAVQELGAAAQSLGENKPTSAAPHQQQALEALERQLQELTKALEAKQAELTAEKFAALARDQVDNHQLTDGISDSVRQLGDSGAGALANLQSAAGNMAGAEKNLGERHAEPASTEQGSAVENLRMARKQLAAELDKLLDQLRADVKGRVMEDLVLMLEKQTAIRESTATLGARAASGGRQVLASIIALSTSEGRLIAVADDLVGLIEETEFGIALPAALIMVRDSMAVVKDSLAAADAGEPVVQRERDIEADLKDLMAAMRQMPSSKGGNDDSDPNRARERELNRIVAELKMIRMVQVRVNRATVQTDGRRSAEAAAIAAELRRQIDNVTNQQVDVREITERLFTTRSDELLQ